MFRYFKAFLEFLWEVIKVAVLSLAIILPIRYFLVQPFYVKGASMEPNFVDHDYLLIDELSYRFREPARGEVVVFRYPRDPRQYFIKRVVGLPGDRVVIRDGAVWVGEGGGELSQVSEPYLEGTVKTQSESPNNDDVVLLPGQYYVLGDNRPQSLDSRSFGAVSGNELIGRIWVRGWPFNRFTVYHPAK
jgi:signal peptidase I